MAMSLWASIQMGSLQVDLQAEGAGYSPDLANDMFKHLHNTFSEALSTAHSLGLVMAADVDDEDD